MMVSVIVFVLVALFVMMVHPHAAASGGACSPSATARPPARPSASTCCGPACRCSCSRPRIAGLGGAVYATQLSAITPTNFDFFSGLPIFMMVVVGGAGFVGGALFAGIGLYGFLPVLTAIWAGVRQDPDRSRRA